MRFQILILSAFLVLFTVTQAVNIRGFTQPNCRGLQWICWNIPPGKCCRFPFPIRSEHWSLPYNTRGIAYYKPSCFGEWPAVLGPRSNSCWNYYPLRVRSTKWQQGYCVWEWKRWILEPREEQCEVDPDNCVSPDTVGYLDPATDQTIYIEVTPDQSKEVAERYEKGDYEGLKRFKQVDGRDTKPAVEGFTASENGTVTQE